MSSTSRKRPEARLRRAWRWLDIERQLRDHGLADAALILLSDLLLVARRWAAGIGGRQTLDCRPDKPDQRWYALWRATAYLGIDLASGKPGVATPESLAWEDATHVSPAQGSLEAINGRCLDISKRRVGEVQGQVFGYDLEIDPLRTSGPIVEKSDLNGLHDGRIVIAPITPTAGCVYQRVVQNEPRPGFAEDLRVALTGARLTLVYRKIRPAQARFVGTNTRVELCAPREAYSRQEEELLLRFADLLGLEVGELDTLRDRRDGRLYVVDANKTCAGPPNGLSHRSRSRSIKLIARDLQLLFGERRAGIH